MATIERRIYSGKASSDLIIKDTISGSFGKEFSLVKGEERGSSPYRHYHVPENLAWL